MGETSTPRGRRGGERRHRRIPCPLILSLNSPHVGKKKKVGISYTTRAVCTQRERALLPPSRALSSLCANGPSVHVPPLRACKRESTISLLPRVPVWGSRQSGGRFWVCVRPFACPPFCAQTGEGGDKMGECAWTFRFFPSPFRAQMKVEVRETVGGAHWPRGVTGVTGVPPSFLAGARPLAQI